MEHPDTFWMTASTQHLVHSLVEQWEGLMGHRKDGVCYLMSAADVVLKVVTVNHVEGLFQLTTPGADPYKRVLLPVMSQIGDRGSKQHRNSHSICVY